MANIEKKVVFELTAGEESQFAYTNLALAEICNQLANENSDALMNSRTGEVMQISDFKMAFNVLDFLLEGNLELIYNW